MLEFCFCRSDFDPTPGECVTYSCIAKPTPIHPIYPFVPLDPSMAVIPVTPLEPPVQKHSIEWIVMITVSSVSLLLVLVMIPLLVFLWKKAYRRNSRVPTQNVISTASPTTEALLPSPAASPQTEQQPIRQAGRVSSFFRNLKTNSRVPPQNVTIAAIPTTEATLPPPATQQQQTIRQAGPVLSFFRNLRTKKQAAEKPTPAISMPNILAVANANFVNTDGGFVDIELNNIPASASAPSNLCNPFENFESNLKDFAASTSKFSLIQSWEKEREPKLFLLIGHNPSENLAATLLQRCQLELWIAEQQETREVTK